MLAALIWGALAGEPAVTVSWDAPEGCPGPAAVEARVRARAADLPEDAVAWGELRGVVRESEGGGLTLEVEIQAGGAVTHKTFTSDRCETLVEAAALAMSIALHPVDVHGPQLVPEAEAEAEPEPAPEPEPDEAVASAAGPEPAPVPTSAVPEPTVSSVDPTGDLSLTGRADAEPTARRGPIVGLQLAPGLDFGMLPGVTGGVRGAVALAGRRYRVQLDGAYWIPRAAALNASPEAGGRVWGYAFGVRGCGVPSTGSLRFPLCAGMEGGVLAGRGTGATVGRQIDRQPWWAATAGPGLLWTFSRRVALALGADLVVPLWRAGFKIGDQVLYRVAPAGFRAFLALEVRLP